VIGAKRVDEITTADVMACLAPIWTTKAETAKPVRQRISTIMKWAIAEGRRTDNPAGDSVVAALPKQNGGNTTVVSFRGLNLLQVLRRVAHGCTNTDISQPEESS